MIFQYLDKEIQKVFLTKDSHSTFSSLLKENGGWRWKEIISFQKKWKKFVEWLYKHTDKTDEFALQFEVVHELSWGGGSLASLTISQARLVLLKN